MDKKSKFKRFAISHFTNANFGISKMTDGESFEFGFGFQN